MNAILDRLDRNTVVITRRVAFIGVLGMLLISIGTITDILMRWLFNSPLTGWNEIVEMGIAISIAATFPAGVSQRINLKIDVLAPFFGPHLTAWLKCAGSISLLIFYSLLTWQIGDHAREFDVTGTTTVYMEWPKGPFIWVVAGLVGIATLAQLVAFMVSVKYALAGRDEPEFGAPRGGDAEERFDVQSKILAITTFVLLALTLAVVLLVGSEVETLAPTAQAWGGATALILFGLMWIAAMLILPLGATMGLIGVVGTGLLIGLDQGLTVMGGEAVEFITNGNLAVLPLFLMMGSFAAAAGLSGDIYNLAHTVLAHRRGGLALATIAGCAGFGALTGSSLATAATIGQIALPEMRSRGYSPGLATGCVAAGGTLGQLVPPSTVIILYAILTEASIGQLFIAAVIPALIAVVLYLITISLYCHFSPEAAPAATARATLAEIWEASRQAWGVLLLFLMVIGGLYGGVFTATEAAAVGAFGAFLFALFRGKLAGGNFWRVMGEVTRTTAMIYILIFGAVTFSFFMGVTGLPQKMTSIINDYQLTPLAVISLLLVVYILLGAIMDPFPVMVITVPIVTPLIGDMGYDLVWWGIIMVCVVETGLITPPFGINVFILKGISGGDVPMWTVFRGVMPFVGADLIKLALLVLFPALILWLPSTMSG